jgi:YtkA-like protein
MFDSNTQRVSNTRMFAIVAGMAIAVMTTVPLRVTAAVQAARDQKATVDIMLTSKPSPPKTGENTFEVMVKDAAGKPITDAEVTAMFVMAATKTMPEMRTT